MRPLISVCIPTYKRVDVLELALRSVVEQRFESMEVVIGDDSPDDSSRTVVERIRDVAPFPIRYRRNVPTLGQSANVDALFRDARGTYAILLHDDDVLLPGAIERLVAPVRRDPRIRVVFGKQQSMDAAGTVQPEETSELNRRYARSGTSGAIHQPLEACLLQRFPNDGYLIDVDLARRVGYGSDLGVYVDAGFGIRLGKALRPAEMWYEDAFIASYRRSNDAVSTSPASRKRDHPAAAVTLYRAVTALPLPPASEYARHSFMQKIADSSVKGFALGKDRSMALRVFLSEAYGWRKRLSIKGAYHLALIISPQFDRVRRY